MAKVKLIETAWRAEGVRRYGTDESQWRFRCPACGHIARMQDWLDAGAPRGAIAYSCVGRWLPQCREAFDAGPGPCNYAGGGLIGLNPVDVETGGKLLAMMDFADQPLTADPQGVLFS